MLRKAGNVMATVKFLSVPVVRRLQVQSLLRCSRTTALFQLPWRPSAMQYSAQSVPEEGAATRLSAKKCVPCKSDMRPMGEENAMLLTEKVPGWNIVKDERILKLQRSWKVKNFLKGIELFQSIADVAEAEGHHPDLHLENWNTVRIEISTHAVGGLTENDFILAAKINDLNFQEFLRKRVADASSSGHVGQR